MRKRESGGKGGEGAARTNKGWIRRENRAGGGNGTVLWSHGSYLSSVKGPWGDLGRRREGGDGSVGGGCGDPHGTP